ncbi:MAG: enhanced serine sensitivity protein SseB C-terminal domain-containing protein [Oscillospiraceae bacterium]
MKMLEPNGVIEENLRAEKLLEQLKTIPKEQFSAHMNQLAQELAMNVRFICAVRYLDENPANGAPSNGSKVEFAMIADAKGNSYYPAFTSMKEFGKWEPMAKTDPQTITVTFSDLARMILGQSGAAGFVVNPFSDNLLINKEAVKRWNEILQYRTKGYAERKLTSESEISFSEYEAIPLSLISALKTAADKSGGVNAMWLRPMTVDGEKSHALIVDYADNSMQVTTALGNAAKEFIGEMNLNIFNVKDGIGQAATQNIEPFYKAE